MPTDHSKQYNTTAPNIRIEWVVIYLPFDNLGRSIARRPTKRFQQILIIEGSQPKIDKFKLPIIIDQYILRFQISMRYLIFMQILDCWDNLMKIFTCNIFIYSTITIWITFSLSGWDEIIIHLRGIRLQGVNFFMSRLFSRGWLYGGDGLISLCRFIFSPYSRPLHAFLSCRLSLSLLFSWLGCAWLSGPCRRNLHRWIYLCFKFCT